MGLFGKTNTQAVIKYSQLQVNTSLLDLPIVLMWGQRRMSANCFWVGDFKKHKANPKGKGLGGKSGQVTYTAAVTLGLGEGPFDSCLNVWQNGSSSSANSLAHYGYTLFLGTASQAPWSYLSTHHPTQALAYMDTGYVAHPNLNLGSSATVPNDAFEMRRLNGFTDTLSAPGWVNPVSHAVTTGIDVNLADVIPDLLTNPQYGINLSFADFDDVTPFRDYTDGQGLYYSPLLAQQEKCTSVLDRWAKISNTWIFWDGVSIRLLPLGDTAIGSFVPDLTPAYNLSVANGDFLDKNPPIVVTRKDPADCNNRCVLEFCDRTRGYISNPAEYKDQTLVDLFGVRDASSTQAQEICNPTVAKIVSQLYGKRQAYIRKTYSFKCSWRRVRLIPGSIVTLTDPNQDMTLELVRITDVTEDKDGNFTFLAEELVQGLGTYFDSNVQAPGDQSNQAFNIDPGNVNTPSIFEADSLLTGGVAKLFVSASGGDNWGGCHILISFDNGGSYNHIGDLFNGAPQGLLTSPLPSYGGSNPDTGHTLAVDFTESETPPQTVTNADADAFRTLSIITAQPTLVGGFEVIPTNGEKLAFGTVTPTGTFSGTSSYLQRGLYGSTASSHSIGDQFTTIDITGTKQCTFPYELPQQYIGKTLCLKFLSFNTFGQETQDASVVTAYKYSPTGVGFGGGTGSGTGLGGAPTVPTGLAVTTSVGANTLTWNPNPETDHVLGYLIFRATGLSQPFTSSHQIGQAGQGATSYIDNTAVNGQGYTYFIAAANLIDFSFPTAGVSITTNGIALNTRTISFSCGTSPGANDVLFIYSAIAGDALAAGLPGSLLTCTTAPTANWTITLKKNGATIGTGTILAGQTSGTYTFASPVTFAANDQFTGTAPGTPDATIAGVSGTIIATKTQ